MTDEQIDALDTFALHWMAPRGRESVREFARAIRAAALEEAAKVCAGALKCTNCGYVGPWKECCGRIDIDRATQDDIAAAIRALKEQR